MATILSFTKSVLLILMVGMCIPVAHSQPALTFNFENYTDAGLKRWDRITLIKMDSSHLRKFTLPEDVEVSRTAWGHIALGSASSPDESDTLFILVARYDSDSPAVYLDKDQDVNFREEKPCHWVPGQAPIEWDLGTSFPHFIQIEPDRESKEAEYQFAYRMLAPPYLQAGLPLLPAQYWWIGKRQATRSVKFELNRQSHQVALYDGNFNGRYDDEGKDQVWMGDARAEPLFTRASGAATLDSDPLLRFGGVVYRVDSISPSGDRLRLMPSDQAYPYLHPGDQVKNAVLHHLHEGTDSLVQLLHPQKLSLLQVWASWCKGCAAQRPYLLELMEQYDEEMHIIGLVDDDPEAARAYAKKYELPWDNWMLAADMKKALMVSHYPYYALVSPKGEVVLLDTSLERLRQYLSR